MAYTKLGRIRPVYSGEWSSGRAYTALEMVKTPDGGLSYIAQKDVPAGTPLTNGEYWAVVLDVREVLEAAKNAADRVDAVMDVKANALSATADGNPVQFSPDEHSIIKPVLTLLPVQSGSGDPSPENVRPIAGRSGAVLGRAGKNLMPKAAANSIEKNGIVFASNGDGSYSIKGTSTGTTAIYFATETPGVISPGVFLHLGNTGIPTNNVAFVLQFSDNTGYDIVFNITNRSQKLEEAFVGKVINTIGIYVNGVQTVDITFKPMMHLDSVPGDFAPYQGDTFTLNFGQTIYGGTLDWNKGEMVVNTGFAAFDGSENWVVFTYADGRQSFYTSGSNALPGIMSGTYIYVPGICSWSPSVDGYITDILRTDVDSAAIEIKPDVLSKWGIGDLDTFKARLAANPMQIAYKLANPITISLTPQQITALAGVNTVYSDADEIMVHYNKSLNAAFEELKNAILAMGGNV